jgi:hypothetical protein
MATEDRAFLDQALAQGQEVGQVAIVGDGDAAGLEIGEHRLDVADAAAAGRGIAGVADGHVAGQALDEVGAGEGVADVAHVAFGVEAVAVEGGDAAGLLAAMLQGMQAQGRDGGRVARAEDAEDAAFQAERVVLRITPWHGRIAVGRLAQEGHRDFSTRSSSFRRWSSS